MSTEVANSSPHEGSLMPLTLQQIAEAFERWEQGFRTQPEKFLTPAECAAMNVNQLSADRAVYFCEMLKPVSNAELK